MQGKIRSGGIILLRKDEEMSRMKECCDDLVYNHPSITNPFYNNLYRHPPYQEAMGTCYKCGYELKFCPMCGTNLQEHMPVGIDGVRRQNEIDVEHVQHDVIGAAIEGNENVIGYNNRRFESNLTKVVSHKSDDKPQNAFAVIDEIRRQNEINIGQIGHDLIGAAVGGYDNVIGYNNKKIESNLTKVVSEENNDKLYQPFWIDINSWYWDIMLRYWKIWGKV